MRMGVPAEAIVRFEERDVMMLAKLTRPYRDLEAAWRAAEEIFWRGLSA